MDTQYINFIRTLGHFPEAFREYLITLDKVSYYSKNSHLVNPDTTSKLGWFILSGLLKKSHYSNEGRYRVTRFWKEGQFATLERCFILQKKSDSYITTVEDCILLPLSYEEMRKNSLPFAEEFMRILLLEAIQTVEDRSRLLDYPLKERYARFIQSFPENRIMGKDIASYLYMDNTTLSKIKAAFLHHKT